QLDGSTVKSGKLIASINDGKFKGSVGTLNIDGSGNVTGTLDIQLNVPGAFVKKVTVTVGTDQLSASVAVGASDFVSKDFPVKSAEMTVKVTQTAGGLDLDLEGSVKVGLDKGFADAQGTLTAKYNAANNTLDAT